jgi:two-component system KDP operon response regulator KdpE
MLNHLKVLVANPDPGIRRLLRRHFERTDCTVVATETAQETLSLIKRTVADLVVASAGMPDMSGPDFTRALRDVVSAPLIILMPPNSRLSASHILDCGADDCIEEPFLLNEFSARARRLLLRGGTKYRSRSVIQGLGLLEIEPLDRSVRLRGESIALTRKEFGLLAVLAAGHGQILTYDEILKKVWGSDYIGAIQNLRRVVSSLRHKIEPDPSRPVYLTSVRGTGYRLTAGAEVPGPASDLNSASCPVD